MHGEDNVASDEEKDAVIARIMDDIEEHEREIGVGGVTASRRETFRGETFFDGRHTIRLVDGD